MQMSLNNIPLDNLAVISNRGAYTFAEENGKLKTTRSVSGLVSAVEPVLTSNKGIWVSWCGRLDNNRNSRGILAAIPTGQSQYNVQEVILNEKEYNAYYHGFSNSTLWPLAHQMIDKCVFEGEYWHAYRRVNYIFARITALVTQQDDLFWVHDYHLMLVPKLLRRYYPLARIAFFWHIPFPPPEVFQLLPWGKQLLQGLLKSDLVAFHTRSYVNNFLACVERYFPAKINQEKGTIRLRDRRIMVRDLPVGIDWRRFEQLASDPQIRLRANQIRHAIGSEYLLLGIDRLDYTKGIPEKIKALGEFLKRYPKYRGRVSLLQIGVPTRNGVDTYDLYRQKIAQVVGEINGLYDQGYGAVPVRYLNRSLDEKELVAHYLAADVMMVTPVRDGLNLVAKEFVASRNDGNGVLLLSTYAGAAEQLDGALLANPYDYEQLAVKIKKALEMSAAEKQEHLKVLKQSVMNKDIQWWWQANLKLVAAVPKIRPVTEDGISSPTKTARLC